MICRPLCFLPPTAWVSSRPRFTPSYPLKGPPHSISKDDIGFEGNYFPQRASCVELL